MNESNFHARLQKGYGNSHVDQERLVGAQAVTGFVDSMAHKLVPLHQSITHHLLVVPANVAFHLGDWRQPAQRYRRDFDGLFD